MSKQKKGHEVDKPVRPGPSWSEVVQNVLIASLTRGQFPIAVAGLIVLVLLWKMEPKDDSRLAFQVLTDLESGYLTGYGIAIAALICWFFHSRWQRRAIAREVERMAREKTKLQSSKTGLQLPSSGRNK